MTDKPDGKRRNLTTAAWIVVAVLVLYPLSIGPVAFFSGTGWLGDGVSRPLSVFYVPLNLLCRAVEPFNRLMHDYEAQSFAIGARFRKADPLPKYPPPK
jgi:hypothetical protein